MEIATSSVNKLLQQRSSGLKRTPCTRNYFNSVVLFWVKMMLLKILTLTQLLLLSTRIELWINWRQDQRDGEKFKMMKMISQHLLRRHLPLKDNKVSPSTLAAI